MLWPTTPRTTRMYGAYKVTRRPWKGLHNRTAAACSCDLAPAAPRTRLLLQTSLVGCETRRNFPSSSSYSYTGTVFVCKSNGKHKYVPLKKKWSELETPEYGERCTASSHHPAQCGEPVAARGRGRNCGGQRGVDEEPDEEVKNNRREARRQACDARSSRCACLHVVCLPVALRTRSTRAVLASRVLNLTYRASSLTPWT